MAISTTQLTEVMMLLEQASDVQLRAIVSSIRLQRTSVQELLEIPPKEMQEVVDSSGFKIKEVPFLEVFKAYLKYKLLKGASSQEKKKYGGQLPSEEEQQLLLRLQQHRMRVDLAKAQEEVLKLRLSNKKDSEEYINVGVLLPILNQGLSNIANQLRSMAMFHPELVENVNECIEEIIRIGFQLTHEAKDEVENYLKEFAVSENQWRELMEELTALNFELEKEPSGLLLQTSGEIL